MTKKMFVEVEMDNDAFVNNEHGELRRILMVAVRALEAHSHSDGRIGEYEINLRDINGNTVGIMSVKEVSHEGVV